MVKDTQGFSKKLAFLHLVEMNHFNVVKVYKFS
jgi:hypothetical protein